MNWRKLGLIYGPDGSKPWAISHAANPTPEHLTGDRFRISFSTRDEKNRSSVAAIEVDLREPGKVLQVSQEPVLAPGELGMFDDCGVSIGCILPVGKRRYLYYMGWNLAVTVPWKNALGLAVSEDGGPFVRHSRFPVLPLSEEDPYTISYPWVLQEGGKYRMWYGSNVRWGPQKEDMQHLIKYAESDDGIHWRRDGRIAIGFKSPAEYAICRPCVIKEGALYRMWFCARGHRYRIGYAESADGLEWKRMDEAAGITVGPADWDNDMIEYPGVFRHGGRYYMLYCGNEYGRAGFGLAVAEP
jgi:predicted GH43/DUF377 family glycosyl hydrolase